ncbi:MAG: hypothetical protein BMS9Abin37_0417 [Acidobacteriota bacterium]|nr:MAG: hypothetical protein BMS9Abin37_0417 [Acidobacteriota bacterium]
MRASCRATEQPTGRTGRNQRPHPLRCAVNSDHAYHRASLLLGIYTAELELRGLPGCMLLLVPGGNEKLQLRRGSFFDGDTYCSSPSRRISRLIRMRISEFVSRRRTVVRPTSLMPDGPLPCAVALERLVVEPGNFPRFLESIVLDRFNPCLKFHRDVSRTLPNLFFRLLRQEDGCDHNPMYTYKVNTSIIEGCFSGPRPRFPFCRPRVRSISLSALW